MAKCKREVSLKLNARFFNRKLGKIGKYGNTIRKSDQRHRNIFQVGSEGKNRQTACSQRRSNPRKNYHHKLRCHKAKRARYRRSNNTHNVIKARERKSWKYRYVIQRWNLYCPMKQSANHNAPRKPRKTPGRQEKQNTNNNTKVIKNWTERIDKKNGEKSIMRPMRTTMLCSSPVKPGNKTRTKLGIAKNAMAERITKAAQNKLINAPTNSSARRESFAHASKKIGIIAVDAAKKSINV